MANPLRNKNREDKRKLRSVYRMKKKISKELKQINKHK